jgi:LacI family transcriptional regulator
MVESRRVTLKDIAKSLGVSVNTVSRALTGKDSVGEDTRARIKAEAERLGYVPNPMARSLVLGSAMTIGLVITNPSNPFYARLISAIEHRGRGAGYSLMLLLTEESPDGDQAAAETLLRWGADGALIVPAVQSDGEHWARVADAGIPLVCLNRDLPDVELDYIGVDYEHGAYEATRHLLESGARTVCLMEEDLPISPVADRITGYRRALADADLATSGGQVLAVPTRRRESLALPWEPADAYRLAQDIVRDGLPDAIMVGNDYFALGVYRALTEAGLRVGEDVLVGGFGDHPFAAYLNPSLTTVALPAADIGTTAVELLLRRMRGQDDHDRADKRRLAAELVVRMSSQRGVT